MNLIVAVSENYGIGKDGKLLFSIPEDMRYFRDMTLGKTVIMGRATLESLPGGKPLRGRRNIVLSGSTGLECETVPDMQRLFGILEDGEEAFVIGGESIYRLLLDYCDRAYITFVEASPPADRFFPNIERMENWTMESQSEVKYQGELRYRFRVYKNIRVKQFNI